jgi:hypothetical protein
MNQSYDFIGVVTEIKDPESIVTANNTDFVKQELWLTDQGKYPQEIKFIFAQKAIEKLNHVTVGDKVVVGFRLNGRTYQKDGSTYNFTELNGFNCTVLEKGHKPDTHDSLPIEDEMAGYPPIKEPVKNETKTPEDIDSLPF